MNAPTPVSMVLAVILSVANVYVGRTPVAGSAVTVARSNNAAVRVNACARSLVMGLKVACGLLVAPFPKGAPSINAVDTVVHALRAIASKNAPKSGSRHRLISSANLRQTAFQPSAH